MTSMKLKIHPHFACSKQITLCGHYLSQCWQKLIQGKLLPQKARECYNFCNTLKRLRAAGCQASREILPPCVLSATFYVCVSFSADRSAVPRPSADLFIFMPNRDQIEIRLVLSRFDWRSTRGGKASRQEASVWLSGLVRLERTNESLLSCWFCIVMVVFFCHILPYVIRTRGEKKFSPLTKFHVWMRLSCVWCRLLELRQHEGLVFPPSFMSEKTRQKQSIQMSNSRWDYSFTKTSKLTTVWFMFIDVQQTSLVGHYCTINKWLYCTAHLPIITSHKSLQAHTFVQLVSIYFACLVGKTRKFHCNAAPGSEVKHQKEDGKVEEVHSVHQDVKITE